MRGLLADVNAVGQMRALLSVCRSPQWAYVWDYLALTAYEFDDFGLDPRSLDSDLWDLCQREQLVLVTGNRNDEDETSLAHAIATRGTVDSLPVFTLADIDRVTIDRDYCYHCAVRMLERLLDMDLIVGSGRIYIP